MPAYSHLLFDNDGVLVDTEHLYFQATQEGLAALGVALSKEEYVRTYMPTGAPPWVLASQLGATDEQIAQTKRWRDQRYLELLNSEPLEIDGVADLLAELSKHCAMAVVTTSQPWSFAAIHEPRNLLAHMSFVLTRADYQRSKPHPDPYLTALARFDIKPHQALVIEDSERGLNAARAAGIDCAVVHNEFTRAQDFAGATYRLSCLQELLAVLEIAG